MDVMGGEPAEWLFTVYISAVMGYLRNNFTGTSIQRYLRIMATLAMNMKEEEE